MTSAESFLRKYVSSFLERKRLLNLCAQMSSHLNKSCLEASLRYWKMDKLLNGR